MKKGTRLDAFLAEHSLSQTREKAKREIIAGWVRVDGETVREPSRHVMGTEDIRVERPGGSFVSRGGQKLDHAMELFKIDVRGRVTADLGASTGGFTDCLLRRGAARVYAVDVGYGQLDFSLRGNPSVVVKERTNVRNLKKEDFPEKVQFVTVDLSFISVTKILDAVLEVFSPVEGLMLIKPQFEAAKSEHKKGVVKSPSAHVAILRRVLENLHDRGVCCKGLCFSPIKGPAGNIEFFTYFETGERSCEAVSRESIAALVDTTVTEAHHNLDR